MVSELRLDNILPLFWPKKKTAQKSLKSRSWSILTFFLGQNMSKLLSKLNSEAIFGILSSRRTFLIPNMKEKLEKIDFSEYFQNFISSM